MAMGARSLPNATTAPVLLLPNRSNRLRVECSSRTSPTCGSSWSNSPSGSRTSCSASRLAFPPLPAFHLQVVEEDEDVEELTFLNDDENDGGSKPGSNWLTPQYLSLRLRCSSLMMREASDALTRHFKDRLPTPKKSITEPIRIKPAEAQHRQLHLISEHFDGPVQIIRDVVIGDIQEGYFQNLTVINPAPSK